MARSQLIARVQAFAVRDAAPHAMLSYTADEVRTLAMAAALKTSHIAAQTRPAISRPMIRRPAPRPRSMPR